MHKFLDECFRNGFVEHGVRWSRFDGPSIRFNGMGPRPRFYFAALCRWISEYSAIRFRVSSLYLVFHAMLTWILDSGPNTSNRIFHSHVLFFSFCKYSLCVDEWCHVHDHRNVLMDWQNVVHIKKSKTCSIVSDHMRTNAVFWTRFSFVTNKLSR